MGDRCQLNIYLPPGYEHYDGFEKWHDQWCPQLESVGELILDEVNYGGDDCVSDLSEIAPFFYGHHSAGYGYEAAMFVHDLEHDPKPQYWTTSSPDNDPTIEWTYQKDTNTVEFVGLEMLRDFLRRWAGMERRINELWGAVLPKKKEVK